MAKKSSQRSRIHQQAFYFTLAALTVCAQTILPSSQLMASSCDDYHAVPPFLSAKLPPNVMFMLDNSGSMKIPLYNSGYNNADYTCGTVATDYNSATDYYGYFESDKNYSYDPLIPVDDTSYSGTPYNISILTSVTGAFVEDSACTIGLGQNCWDGNFLNWVSTRRIDAARKVMIGGKVESRGGFDYVTGDSSDLEWKLVANNERSDRTICKKDSAGQNYTPYPDDTVFTVASPANNVEIVDTYDPYAKLLANSTAATLILDENDNVIGESGLEIDFSEDAYDGLWHTVTFTNTYAVAPVVVVGPLSYNGSDPAEYRVSDITTTSFKVRTEEWEYKNDGGHYKEDISYLVLEAGTHTLPGGQKITAGNTSRDHTFATVTLGQTHDAIPVILASVTTNNDPDTVTVRLDNVTTTSFDIRLQEEEIKDNASETHTAEDVCYIALDKGVYTVGGATLEVSSFDTTAGSSLQTIGLANTGDQRFLASMQTYNDSDPASIRYDDLKTHSVAVLIQEEDSLDSERDHQTETVGYVSIRPAQYNLAVIVENEPEGLAQSLEEDVRLGISFYRYQKDSDIYNDEWAHGGTLSLDIPENPFAKNPSTFRTVDTPVKTETSVIIDAIEHYPLVWGTTPLAENYYEIIRYFQQEDPYYNDKPTIGSTYTYKTYDPDLAFDSVTNNHLWDPYYYEEYGESIRCAKSFVLLFTDGAPYRDDYVPNFYDSTGNGGAPDTVDYDNDGDGGDCTDTGNTANSCKNTLDDLAYWAYWDKDGTPDFRDLRTKLDASGDPLLSGNQYIETYTVAFGTSTIPDILQDTADNGNGTAYAAEDGTQLEASLAEAFSSILKKTAAGSSLSVLSERATDGSVIHQALFFPEKTFLDGADIFSVSWTGALNAYWFFNNGSVTNIREDNATLPDGEPYYLDIHDDHSLVFRIDEEGELRIDYYSLHDDPSSQLIDGSSDTLLGTYTDVDDITKIWEGGTILKDRFVEPRVIYGVDESGSMLDFSTANYTDFDDLLNLSTTDTSDCLGTVSASATATELQQRAENLISYTRGVSDTFAGNNGGDCRNRVVDNAGSIWKLGDIIYSTPQLISYPENSLLVTGANDGMLHAFEIGAVRKDGLSAEQIVRLCDTATGLCTQNTIGDELWSFIPQNAMPYLKYLADPDYKHIYSIDLSPYVIDTGGKKIIVGGMRFGGATGSTTAKNNWLGDTDGDGTINTDGEGTALQVVPPECSPANPEACIGYSSYFAIDVTNKEKPVFLWEYSHPRLGYSYSGPAFISRGDKRYVMFTSGPLNYKADAVAKDLKMFIIEVDEDFMMVDTNNDSAINDTDVYKIDGNADPGFKATPEFGSFNNSFGGRLFTDGIDYNNDGNTEVVFFGVSTGTNASGWVGDVIAVAPNDDPPIDSKGKITWEITKVYNDPHAAITTKIAFSRCFNEAFIYFGSGRWFYKDDSPGSVAHPLTGLYGVQMTACLDSLIAGGTCSGGFNQVAATKVGDQLCATLSDDLAKSKVNWVISENELEEQGGGFLRERTITDPTTLDPNIVFFTTTQPSADPCEFGGRTRIWGLNCLTGHGMFDGCSNEFTAVTKSGSLLIQLSGGNIEEADLDKDTFTNEGNKVTDWVKGIPPESAPPFVPHSGLRGEIIIWIER